MKRKRLIIFGAAVIFAASMVFFIYWLLVGRYMEGTNNAYLQADVVVISPKVAGYVSAVAVNDNQSVEVNQLLVRIDAAPYQASLDLANAQVAASRADIVRYRADILRQKAVSAEMEAQANVAGTAARLASVDAGRFERLSRTGADTVQKRDAALAEKEMRQGQFIAAQAAAQSARQQISALDAQLKQGQAAVSAAEARARNARTDFEGGNIISPMKGIVGDRTVRVGQYVQPGTRLMTIVPIQDLYLIANFKETQLARMRVGQPAEVHIDAMGGTRIEGVIDSLAPGTGAQFALLPPENATGNFTKIVQRVPVRIRMRLTDEQRSQLRPGLSAEVEIDTRGADRR